MIKKIKLIIGITTASCFFANVFAAELPHSILSQCENYIKNPTEQAGKDNADALKQCYENNVCENQLSTVSHCAKNLSSWNLNYVPSRLETTAPAETFVTTPAPVAPAIQVPAQAPAQVPTQVPVQIPIQTPTAEPVKQPTVNSDETTPQPKKEKQPSINWF